MLAMGFVSPSRIAGCNGGQHLAMFLIRNREASTLNKASGTEQVQLLHKAAVLLRKHGITGRINDELVECQVERVVSFEVTLLRGLFHLDHKPGQLLKLIVCNPLSQQLSGKTEQSRTDLIDLPYFLNRQAT